MQLNALLNCLDTLSGLQQPFFNEFVIRCPASALEINDHLLDHDILGGYDLSQDYPDLENHILFAVTEMNTRHQIDTLVDVLSEVNHG